MTTWSTIGFGWTIKVDWYCSDRVTGTAAKSKNSHIHLYFLTILPFIASFSLGVISIRKGPSGKSLLGMYLLSLLFFQLNSTPSQTICTKCTCLKQLHPVRLCVFCWLIWTDVLAKLQWTYHSYNTHSHSDLSIHLCVGLYIMYIDRHRMSDRKVIFVYHLTHFIFRS